MCHCLRRTGGRCLPVRALLAVALWWAEEASSALLVTETFLVCREQWHGTSGNPVCANMLTPLSRREHATQQERSTSLEVKLRRVDQVAFEIRGQGGDGGRLGAIGDVAIGADEIERGLRGAEFGARGLVRDQVRGDQARIGVLDD